jgi:catechol O-methyltransferase
MSSAGKKIPFLRWSFLRMLFGMKHLTTVWQVGDGREARLADHVIAHARRHDPADVLRVIDEFAYNESFLINVGDEKGGILDAAIAEARPSRILELGTYCGYSALRMAIAAPAARIFSIEFNAANAAIARRIHEHAGVSDRITIVVGTLGDGGKTAGVLESSHGFSRGSLDFVFIDHDKAAYLPDLELILRHGWLRKGAVAVADNIKFPGAPDYLAYMRNHEGSLWRSQEHETHAEYQTLIKDLVLVSTHLGNR